MMNFDSFRFWYYLRIGWGSYFSFIFSFIYSTVTVYFLAIQKIDFIRDFFPNFISFILCIIAIGFPIIAISGITYFKKSSQFSSEMDIRVESNPYTKRLQTNSDVSLFIHSTLIDLLLKKYSNQIQEDDKKNLSILKKSMDDYVKRNPLN